jgi:hypothetical protein
VFHALHDGHWPAHFGDCPPHSLQMYNVFGLATRYSARTGTRGATAHISS